MKSVYKLIVGDCYYYGHTSTTLKERLRTHHVDFLRLNTKLYAKAKMVGWDNVKIELVKECENAREEEDRLIGSSLSDPLCLNMRRVSSVDIKAYQKEYFAKLTPEKQREYSQRAYQKNKVVINERASLYREENKERLRQQANARFANKTREERDEINRLKRERRKIRD
jgi:hypothetical protein